MLQLRNPDALFQYVRTSFLVYLREPVVFILIDNRLEGHKVVCNCATTSQLSAILTGTME